MFGMRDLIPWNREKSIRPSSRDWEHSLAIFQRDMDRLFEDLWRGFDLPMISQHEGRISPRVDVRETDGAVIVSAELPGLDEKDVDVAFSDGVLAIKGEKRTQHETEDKGYSYSERSYGTFERRISVGTDILEEKAEAAFSNGVLTVTLPKSPEAKNQAKRIAIKASGEAETAVHSEEKAA